MAYVFWLSQILAVEDKVLSDNNGNCMYNQNFSFWLAATTRADV